MSLCIVHTWRVTETGVSGCVSLTGDTPTLGAFTRAEEQDTREHCMLTCMLEGHSVFMLNVQHTQTEFVRAICNLDDLMALPWQRVEHAD